MVTRTPSRATSLLALLAVVFLLATACSDDSGGDASSETTAGDGATTTTAAGDVEPPSESPAASLRSDLTGLLEEQVYLTALTVQSASGGAITDPVPAAYVVESSTSADELANIIGGAYGIAAADDFVAAWNDHRQAIVDYGLNGAPASGVDTTRQAVLDVLADLDADAAFTDVADSLEASDTALLQAVDQLNAEDPAAANTLRAAADEMPPAGLDLATTIADHALTEGEVDSPESALRADLTSQLQESSLLTGLALSEIVRASGDITAPGPLGARDAIDENTDEIAATMLPEDAAGATQLAELWSDHIDAFEQYTAALVNDDAQGIQDSQDALVQFRDDVGELLADTYPGFTKEQVAEELVDHTDSVLAYADALVREAGDVADGVDETSQVSDQPSEAPSLLRTAALNMRLAARSLALGMTSPAASDEPAAG